MPLTSIIIPCYNEAATIRLLLETIRCQTYPLVDMEVIIADGMSSDGTKQIVSEYQRQFPEMTIRWVENPKRIIPAALNAALRAARGEWVVRLDAHSVPAPDYVERCVNGLRSGIGDNVGGVWDIRPGGPGWIAQSIAVAAAHPLGAGDARYRYTSQAGEVDTVPFGSYRRDLFERIGIFDETLLTNEDYELNVRLRKSGGRIYLDPAIRTVYFARPNLSALAKQYWRYGFWKQRMLRRYAETLRWRQALPPLFVLSLVVLLALGIFFPVFRWLLAAELAVYLTVLLAAGLAAAVRKKQAFLMIGLPLALITMHISWGAGFLASLLVSR